MEPRAAEDEKAAEGATALGQASRSETRRGRSGTTEVAEWRPARDSGRASTCTILAFTQIGPRIDLCNDDGIRVRLDRYKPQCRDPWPPFLKCNYSRTDRWTKVVRQNYNEGMRGMTPVYTAVGQGTLWVGIMFLARNLCAMKSNRSRVRMSCLGQDVRSLTRMKGSWGSLPREAQ